MPDFTCFFEVSAQISLVLLLVGGCGKISGEGSATATAGTTAATTTTGGSGVTSTTATSAGTGVITASGTATGGLDTGAGTTGGSTGGVGTLGSSSGGVGTVGGSSGGSGTSGTTGGVGTSGSTGGGGNCDGLLPVTIRDFHASHPDFESYIGSDPGIVEVDLGVDEKPVYAGQAGNPSTTGKDNFDQWYRDVPGVNMAISSALQLVETMPGIWVFDDQNFFPIDGQGFGNEGNAHNYHFTLELHTKFTYLGGEQFTFRGDDDVFVFMNGKLAIDLGGVHSPQMATIDLDAQAANLGLVVGNTYDLDLFFAERHTVLSSFRIETTIACFLPQ